MHENLSPQIFCFRRGLRFAVFYFFKNMVECSCTVAAQDFAFRRSVQRVVHISELVVALVPGTQGLAEGVAACDAAIVYPVAVGLVSAAHAILLPAAMHAFLHALVSNWISAGARLIPLGQTDSQRVLAALEPLVVSTAARALGSGLDDLASATFRADLASLRHETQYTRLFRS